MVDVEEDYPADLPKKEIGIYLAKKKNAANRAAAADDEVVLTSDTTVIVGDESLEKAANEDEAMEMLRKINGVWHDVISGVCISSAEKTIAFDVTTKVKLFELSEAEMNHYVQVHKPFDKAGAYGIQDWFGLIGIEEIRGSFYNVVGLPIAEVYRCLASEFGIRPEGV